MRTIPLPSVDYLRSRFEYNSETGDLFWKNCACNGGRRTGLPAGTVSKVDGYRRVKLDGRRYLTHRIIWKLVTGRDPTANVDHKDGRRAHNRAHNLRDATSTENQRNRHIVTGPWPKGVYLDKERDAFVAQIRSPHRKQYLGTFDTPEAAHVAYLAAARADFGAFACAGSKINQEEGVFQ